MTDQKGLAMFKTFPLAVDNGIPVFSTRDKYVMNYEKIASDHVSKMKPGVDNPFIENELWETLEQSTHNLIRKHVHKQMHILDVGVGLGRLLGSLSDYKRHGIDISFDYLKIAKEKGINVAFSKIEDMPYEDGFFDAIVACDVLEHVIDLNECCRQILRVLKIGGVLIVRVPFKEDLSPYLSDDSAYEYVHLRAFDEQSLRLLFAKVFGMEFIEAAPVAPYLQGTPRLKVQLLPEPVRAKLAATVCQFRAPTEILRKIVQVSAEDFMYWIYDLRDNHKEDYLKIAKDLVLGMDINAVFRKSS